MWGCLVMEPEASPRQVPSRKNFQVRFGLKTDPIASALYSRVCGIHLVKLDHGSSSQQGRCKHLAA